MTTRGNTNLPGPNGGIDETHDPNLRSWVESANDPTTDFPIQNLPLALCGMTNISSQGVHALVPIGDSFLDLDQLVVCKLLDKRIYQIGRASCRERV